MTEVKIDQIEEEIVASEVSDEALEAAARTEKLGNLTYPFCGTDLASCPG